MGADPQPFRSGIHEYRVDLLVEPAVILDDLVLLLNLLNMVGHAFIVVLV